MPSVALSGAVLSFFFRGRCTLPRNYTRKQNSHKNFPSTFLELSLFQIFGKQNVFEPNFVNFFGDFQLDILHAVLMNLSKNGCPKLSQFLGETGHEPKFQKKYGVNSPIFLIKFFLVRLVRGGSNLWAFREEAVGQTRLLGS